MLRVTWLENITYPRDVCWFILGWTCDMYPPITVEKYPVVGEMQW